MRRGLLTIVCVNLIGITSSFCGQDSSVKPELPCKYNILDRDPCVETVHPFNRLNVDDLVRLILIHKLYNSETKITVNNDSVQLGNIANGFII